MPEKEKLLADIEAALLEVIGPLAAEAVMIVLLNPIIDKFFEENNIQAKNRIWGLKENA